MSVPYGTSQPPAPHNTAGGPNLGPVLALVAAGLALVSYACSFSDDALGFGGLVLPLLLAGGLLAGASAMPRAPRTMLPAAVLSATAALALLHGVITSEGDTQAIIVVILIASLLQTAACVVALLVDAGLVNLQPKPSGYGAPPPAWGPQSGSFPQQGGQFPYGQQPQQFGGPQQQTQVFGHGQGQGQYGGQPGQSQSQPGQSQPGQSGQPPFGQQPYGQGQQQGQQQGQYGGQSQQQGQQPPGTPPGGLSNPS